MEDGRDDLKQIQNGSYFHKGPPETYECKEI